MSPMSALLSLSNWASSLFLIFLTASAFYARHILNQRDLSDRWLKAFLPALAVLTLTLLFHRIHDVIYDEHSWIRFEKSFVMAMGQPIYYGQVSGAAMASIYGPGSVIGYLPATLSWHPMVTIRLAEALAILYFFIPPLWLHLGSIRQRPAFRHAAWVAFLGFAAAAILLTSLRQAAFTVHADAPALGLGALACGFLYFRKRPDDWIALIASGLCAALAVWTKQVAVPLYIALPLYVFLADGPRILFRYVIVLLLTGLLVSGTFILIFPAQEMFFNMLTLPSRHSYREGGLGMVLKSFSKMAREWLLMLLWGIFAFVPAFQKLKESSPGSWMRRNPWSIFLLTGICMIPVALLSNIKVGGSNNTLSHANYFFLLASTLAFLHYPGVSSTGVDAPPSWMNRFFAAWAIFLLVILTPVAAARMVTLGSEDNYAMRAYEYAKQNPGKSYFPRLTLLHILAEKKIYHTIDGLMDRHWAGLPVQNEHLLRHIPKDAELIAYHGENHHWLLPLPKFTSGRTDDPEFPGFMVYRKRSR